MKNYNVTYTKGHLIDTKTSNRIFLKRGGSFTLLGDDDQFEVKDDLEIQENPLNSTDKLNDLKEKYKHHRLELVANQGTKFVYRIGLRRKTNEDKSRAFLFDAILLEDLYIKTRIKILNEKEVDKWSLCDCICKTTECIDGEAQIIEETMGLSLSNLFSNMVAFYFPMQRTGVCNAFKTFFFVRNDNHKLFEVENHQYGRNTMLENIDDFRINLITKQINQSADK